jgi:hypothetical protein
VAENYTNRDAVKHDLNITDTVDDDAIDSSIAAASRYIDSLTGTTFYPITEARRYAVSDSGVVWTDRFVDTTGLVVKTGTGGTYSTTLAASSYLAAPYNAATSGGAYDRIEVPGGTIPLGSWPSVEITATWGYPEPPAPVERACRLIAAQLFRRKDSPEYTAGTSEFGVITATPGVDTVALRLLRPYIDPGIA